MSAKSIDLSQPNRLHMGGMAIFFGLSAKKFIQYIWPILLIRVFDKDGSMLAAFILLGIIAAVAIIHALLEYLYFTFQITSGELTVRSGYIRKKQVSVPLSKIQSLNMKQNLLQRLLKIYELEVNTAGAKGSEVTLQALSLTTIREVEQLVNLGSSNISEEEHDAEAPPITNEEHEQTIMRLSPADLLRVGLTNNHVKVILIVYGFLFGIYDDLPERWQRLVVDTLDQFSAQASSQLAIYLALGLLCAIIFTVTGAILATFAWHFNLKLSHTPSRLVLDAGLIAHKRVLIPFRKIQTLTWTTNPLRRLIGIFAVSVGQASSLEETEKMKANVPGCTDAQVEQIQQALFGTSLMAQPELLHRSHWIYLRNLWLMLGLAPAAVVSIVGYLADSPLVWSWLWAIVYLPFAYLSWRHAYFYMDEQHVVVSSGSFGHKRQMFALHKIQGVSVRQSIWQKPRGRASATLYLAGETITLSQIDAATAYALRDYALFLAESEQQPWM